MSTVRKSKRLTPKEVQEVHRILWEQQNQFQPIIESIGMLWNCHKRYTVAGADYYLNNNNELWKFLPFADTENCMTLVFHPLIRVLVLKYGEN